MILNASAQLKTQLGWHQFVQVEPDAVHASWLEPLAYKNLYNKLANFSVCQGGLSQYLREALDIADAPSQIDFHTATLVLTLNRQLADSLRHAATMLLALPYGREISGSIKQVFANQLDDARLRLVRAYADDEFVQLFYRWIPYRSLKAIVNQGVEAQLAVISYELWRLIACLLPWGLYSRLSLMLPKSEQLDVQSLNQQYFPDEQSNDLKKEIIHWLANQLTSEGGSC